MESEIANAEKISGSIDTRTVGILKADVSVLQLYTTLETLSPTDVGPYAPVDYNSWIESDKALKLAASLDKDVVLAEGMINLPSLISRSFGPLSLVLLLGHEYPSRPCYMVSVVKHGISCV